MGDRESKRNIVLVAILFLCFVIVGVAFRFLVYPTMQGDLVAVTGSESRYHSEVRILLDSFSGYAPLRSPALREELESRGIKLELNNDQADYQQRMKALSKGDTDLAVFTVDAFVASGAGLGEFPGTIVMVLDETYGADAIVAYEQGASSLRDLDHADARLVLTPASPSEFLARVAIAEFGLDRLSTSWREADGAGAVYQQMRGAPRSERRAWVLWEPFTSQALEDPDVHVLFDSSQLSGYIVDVLVARRQYLLDHPDVVRAVVEAWLRTLHNASSQPGGLVQLVQRDSEITGDPLTASQAQHVVEGIRWRNTLENYAYFGSVPTERVPGIMHIEDSIDNIADILLRTGALGANPVAGRASELFYRGVLDAMMVEDFHPGKGLGIVDGGKGTADLRSSVHDELPALSDEDWAGLTPVGSLRVKPIAFGRGTARLNVQSQRELDGLARRLQSLPRFYLTVWGHARAEGDPAANLALAQERAGSALAYLVIHGVSAKRIRALAAEPSGTGGEHQSVSFELSQHAY